MKSFRKYVLKGFLKKQSIDKTSGFFYSKIRYRVKGRERKSRKMKCNREKMSPAESIFYRKFFEVHSGADLVNF